MYELIDAYKNLDINDKRNELADEFTEFIGIINKLKKDVEIDENVNLSPLKKLYDKTENEEGYLCFIYENILNVKEELAEYLDKVIDLYYENENLE